MIALQWVKKYMRIGILTHHYVKNYGAFLQMKALYETLREVYPKADIRIVNFICQEHLWRNIIHVLHYRRKSDTPVIYREKIRQLRTFIRYERSLPRTARVGTAEEIEAKNGFKPRRTAPTLGKGDNPAREIWALADNPEIPLCPNIKESGRCCKEGGPDKCPLWDRPKEEAPKMDVNPGPPRRTRKKRGEG